MTKDFISPDPLTVKYFRPDYQAAYSQLARRFTILSCNVNHIDLGPTAANCINKAMELIEMVEKAERTVQIVHEEES